MAKTGPKAKLSASDAAQVHRLAAQGMSDAQIAARFGVSRATIQRVRNASEPAIESISADAGEALSQYRALAMSAYSSASHGADASAEIAYLKQAENAFAVNGITRNDGSAYRSSMFAELAQRSARIRST